MEHNYTENQIAQIRAGGVSHEAWVVPITPPVVGLVNNDDDHYAQYFQNWDEVSAFIKRLEEEAAKAFGPKPI